MTDADRTASDEGDLLPVYLVHWGAPTWCCESATAAVAAVGIAVAVAVVDNGPPSDSLVLRGCLPPDVRILTQPTNVGYAGGANAALADWSTRYRTSPFAVVMSHDVLLDPGALSALVVEATTRANVGVLAPAISNAAAGTPGECLSPVTEAREWVSGTCLLLRRACVNDVGTFDQAFGSYVEDVDYCLRAWDAGWVVARTAAAVGDSRGTSDPLAAALLVTANRVLLTLKREGVRRALVAWLKVVCISARAALGGVAPWRSTIQRRSSRFYARAYGLGALRAAMKVIGTRRRVD